LFSMAVSLLQPEKHPSGKKTLSIYEYLSTSWTLTPGNVSMDRQEPSQTHPALYENNNQLK
jgi:hypothetical protein